MEIPFDFSDRLKIPLIVAPMFLVSTPQLALAACRSGIIGSYPAHTTRTRQEFVQWLIDTQLGLQALEDAGEAPAPYAVNLVVHATNARMQDDLELCIEHKVPIILTSKGAPTGVFQRIHDYGGLAFHDVASARHAEKALEAGADALIAVCGGAGGHTGTINPFALINEIREITDKPIILAGGMSNGKDILAAQAMGACMVYMGTRFIATHESLAPEAYRKAVIKGRATDVLLSSALDGAPTNWLAPSLIEAGIDPAELAATKPGSVVAAQQFKERYKAIWTAGHGVGATKRVESTQQICEQLIAEYTEAVSDFHRRLSLA